MPSLDRPLRVLVVEDDTTDFFIIREHIRGIQNRTFIVDQCANYDEALTLICAKKYDIYFIDYRLGAKTGLDLLRDALLNGCEEPLILLTGRGNSLIDQEAMEMGAADYLLKSEISSENLERSIRYALSRAAVLSALRSSEKKYRAVFERSKEAIFIADSNLQLKDFNEATGALFGNPADNVRQFNLFDFITNPDSREKIESGLREAGEVKDLEVDLINSGGDIKNCVLSLSTDNSHPEEVNIHGVIHNITSLKKAEKAMLQAERLASTWRLASALAHEVRNPLSTIQMSVEQIDDSGIKDEDKFLLEIISRNSQRIDGLITRLLESSRPDEGQPQVLDLRSVMEESIQTTKDRTSLNGITISFDFPRRPCLINANAERLRIAFINILVNAIEAVQPNIGKISIQIHRDEDKYVIDLADNGCGIPAENLGSLFEPYFTSKKNGIGLGLAATMNIIKSHSGEIEVESYPDKGTHFKIILPQITATTAYLSVR
jgi:PAS domain S-box-containing protein